MKKAKLVAVAVEVHCPYCEAPMSNPKHGSHMWEHREVVAVEQTGQPFHCMDCGKGFLVNTPAKVNFL